ncbi:hypothetical protein AAHH67_21325 [Niallia circulans]
MMAPLTPRTCKIKGLQQRKAIYIQISLYTTEESDKKESSVNHQLKQEKGKIVPSTPI